jgi:O-methyltransferase involved in polyketide biosynthesis
MYPIINRGTWARVQVFREQIVKFLTAFNSEGQTKTVLNLGSGYDTTFFWLQDNHPTLCNNLVWVEVDYDSVVEKKTRIIKKTEAMNRHVANNKFPESDYMIDADNFKTFSFDIRNTSGLGLKLADFNVSKDTPTLVMTECLLIYLENKDSNAILKFLAENFDSAPYLSLLNYEMILPFDQFGQTMINNLRERGCDLLGIEGCPTM